MSMNPQAAVATFAPTPPVERCAPQRISDGTWLVRQAQGALGAPLYVYLNSMVITGSEPIIVDTGTASNRRHWLDDVFGIVDPDDVRWIFLSHDDADHTGNLAEAMTCCRHATLVCSWALVERLTNAFHFPLSRCRWVDDGDTFDAGDRRFRAIRPPVYDSPTTRGLLDESTGVYWASDAFATPMHHPSVETVAELDATLWRDGHHMFSHHALSPWLGIVDERRFAAAVDRIRSLGLTTIAGAHTPTIFGDRVEAAFDLMGDLVTTAVPPCPDQTMLDALLAASVA